MSEARAMLERALELDGDLVAAFADSRDRQAAAFARPGAADAVCHHPMRDMPGADFIWLRVRDTLIHTWDLARAIGADASLDPELVAVVWEQVEPVAPFLAATGMFGSGSSGAVADSADPQARLLDAVGRRL